MIRAWDVEAGRMYYALKTHTRGILQFEFHGNLSDDIVYMPYVGIRDEYARHIYDRDIIRLTGSAGVIVSEVEFGPNGACFEDNRQHMCRILQMSDKTRIHVLGNRYETPELLGMCGRFFTPEEAEMIADISVEEDDA